VCETPLQFKEYSANYKKSLEIAEEMTILNMELLKADACL